MAHLPDESAALALDATDPLRSFRDQFYLPEHNGAPAIYFCGHSLGLQPRGVAPLIQEELAIWATRGVEGHFGKATAWYGYHELVREGAARLVGAKPDEVVFMNSLTVNLHLMLATFFRPTKNRFKLLIDEPTFPSDRYAALTHLRHRDLSPQALVTTDATTEAIEETLDREGESIAVALLSGVNFLTGQVLDIPRLAKTAHRRGCILGLDLAHAAGNLALALHEWEVDFAVWCSYKYMNSGPGAVGGCFVHQKHGSDTTLPRLGGWWGNDPATRFRMHLESDFIPRPGADGWQLSNPPILALAPIRASLELFGRATMPALRARSLRLTGYLLELLSLLPEGSVKIITPTDPPQRGAQVSLVVNNRPREARQALEAEGVVCDFREPNVIRAAPVPLYNTFHEVWRFVRILSRVVGS